MLSTYFNFETQAWKSIWAEGRSVKVHYKRGDPSYAYLLKSASGLPIYLLTFCVVPLIIAVGLAFEAGRKSGFWRSWIAFLVPEGKPRYWIFAYLAIHPLVALALYGWEVASLRLGPTVLAICVYYLGLGAMIPFGRFAMSIGAIPRRSLKKSSGE